MHAFMRVQQTELCRYGLQTCSSHAADRTKVLWAKGEQELVTEREYGAMSKETTKTVSAGKVANGASKPMKAPSSEPSGSTGYGMEVRGVLYKTQTRKGNLNTRQFYCDYYS